MAIDYRLIRAEEEDTALHFWAEMFNTEYGDMQREFSTDPQRLLHTYVAVAPDNTLLSTASYCLRELRDSHGVPRLVGVVWNVATRADARKQGHAAQLMARVLEALRGDGCVWSMLFTSGAGRSLYTRFGYSDFPVPYREGTISNARPLCLEDYDVQRYDPRTEPAGWAALAAVYSSFNARRPLTVVRDVSYWYSGYAAYKFSRWFEEYGVVVLGITRKAESHNLCGYVLAHFGQKSFRIFELGVMRDDIEAIAPLLTAVVDEAARRGFNQGKVYLPREPQVDAVLEQLFAGPLRWGHNDGLMARGIASDVDRHYLDTLFAAPGAIHWIIDEC